MSELIVIDVFAFLFGACIGSFLNVCIERWPAKMSVVSPPSRCPTCERPIRAYENIPIFGWIALRGRCAGCKSRISPQYPLVELLIALIWLGAAALFGPTLLALRVAVFITLMIGVAITDAKYYEIPDGFTVFGLIWMIAVAFVAVFTGSDSAFATPYDAMMGALTGAGAIAIAGWLGEAALKREAMGFGDVTLMAVIGAALGPQRALLTIFIGAALGVVVFVAVVIPVGRARAHGAGPDGSGDTGLAALPLVPFGVFLAPASVVALFYGDVLIQWYFTRFIAS
jgi:leader peptidase (prepilin peptidase)/N-methyltransferase